MSQDTNISQLVINKLTKQQYDSIVTPNESELYLITDDVGITDTDIIAALGYTPQEELVSGTNIKTINNTSLLGNGNIEIQGGGSITIDQTYDPTSANAQSGVAIAGANFLTASSLNNYVTTNTDQNITGTKTFVGQKKIGFKQSASNNKLGFTLYDNNNVEKGCLEFNPTNTIDGAPLMTLGNYASAAAGITHVGFRKYDSSNSGAYNLLAPLVSKAKSPFNLTTTYTNFYLPLGFTDGTTTVKAANTGMVDLSPILPTNILPSQTGQSGKFLTTDGTNPSWATVSVTVDQTYDPTSANAQSGVAMAGALETKQDILAAGNNITIVEGGSGEDETVSGNGSIVLEKALADALNSVTITGGYEQTGTPAPDAPIDIISNNGAIKHSANMANVNAQTALVGYYISTQGVVTADVYNWIYQDFIPVKPNTTYTLTMSSSVYYVSISEYSTADDSGFVIRKVGSTGSNTTLTITTGSTTNYIRFGTNLNRVAVTLDAVLAIDWMLNVGNTMTYQPYVEGGIYTDGTTETVEVDTTGDTATAEMLLGIGDTKDTQEILTGAVTRNIGVLVLDGTENWQLANGSGYRQFYITDTQGVIAGSVSLVSNIAPYGCTASTRTDYQYGCYSGGSGNLCFQMIGSSTLTSVQAWTNYLVSQYNAGTPVIVVYPRASATTETVTAQSLTIQEGTNVVEISQAAISNLPISANYTQDSRLRINATVGNGTITIYQGSTLKGSFTLNQSGDTTINLNDGGGTVDQTYDPTSTNAQSGVALSEVFDEKQDTLIVGDHITINEVTPHWSQAEEVSNLHLNSFDWVSIAYGDNKFVILGDEGYTSTSIDGTEWTSAVKNPNLFQPCVGYTVTYGDGKFVALSYEGHLSSSVDGVTWAASEVESVLEHGGWKSIAYGNGKFVALGYMGYISTSNDGSTWAQPEQYAPDEYGDSAGYNVIAYGSNKFVVMDARGYVATSTNGTDWTDLGAISNLGNHGWEALTYDGEKFIAIGGDGYFSSSEDGVTWELSVLIPQLEVDTRWVSVACSESKIVTLGNSNYIGVYSDVSGPMISAHFDVDQIFDSTSTNAQSGIAIAGALDKKQTKLIAGNNIEILEPSWSQAKTVSNLDIHDPWGCIAYGANKFVIVGTDGYLSTSEDGLNWTLAEQNENLHYANSIGYDALVYGDGKFVAESNSAISTSTDGITWSSVTYSSNLSGYDWKGMAYGDGKFVILGEDGFISTSTDGTTWTQAAQAIDNSEMEEFWRSIAYNGIKFVALSVGGSISTSTDGVAWSTPVQDLTLGNRAWRSIVYNGMKFVALDSTGRYSTSVDGTTWTTVVQDSNLGNRGWAAMASNEEKIVAVNSYTYVSEYYNNPLISASFAPFTGADGTNAGTPGAVPAPLATDNNKFLKGDGTWGAVTTNALVIRDYTVSS